MVFGSPFVLSSTWYGYKIVSKRFRTDNNSAGLRERQEVCLVRAIADVNDEENLTLLLVNHALKATAPRLVTTPNVHSSKSRRRADQSHNARNAENSAKLNVCTLNAYAVRPSWRIRKKI